MEKYPKQEWSKPKHRYLSLSKIKVRKGILLELFYYSVVSEGKAGKKIVESMQEEDIRKCRMKEKCNTLRNFAWPLKVERTSGKLFKKYSFVLFCFFSVNLR